MLTGIGILIAGPAAYILLFYMWRHPWESLAVIGLFVAAVIVSAYVQWQSANAPAVELDNADTAKAQQDAARYALLDAWKPKADSEIEGVWPASKPVAKHVRHPSGVGLKLNRD